MDENFMYAVTHWREDIKAIEAKTRELISHRIFNDAESYPTQHAEMRANIMLAVCHLEDARMHLGKLLQYAADGVSKFDKAAG